MKITRMLSVEFEISKDIEDLIPLIVNTLGKTPEALISEAVDAHFSQLGREVARKMEDFRRTMSEMLDNDEDDDGSSIFNSTAAVTPKPKAPKPKAAEPNPSRPRSHRLGMMPDDTSDLDDLFTGLK